MSAPPEPSLVDVLRLHGRHLGGRTALVDDSAVPVSYAELWRTAAGFAGHLVALGVRPGDRVALALEPSSAYVAAMVGVLAAGATAVPVNTRLADPEVAAYLASAGVPWLVHDAAHGRVDDGTRAAVFVERSLDAVVLADRLPQGAPTHRPVAAEAVVFGTGGTTGRPKAVAWSGAGLCRALASSCANLAVRRDDVELYASPFFHLTIVTGLLTTLYTGGTVRLLRAFDADRVAAELGAGGITRLFGAPVALERVCATPGLRAPRLRMVVYGSAPSASDLPARLAAAFPGAQLMTGYGATEFGAVTRVHPWEIDDPGVGVGRPVTGVELAVVDGDGRPLGSGEPGDVVVASPWQMSRYLADEARTVDLGGRAGIVSGDIGAIDEHGRLHLLGRRGDMIVTGGENVYPSEVERVLGAHPSVTDVAVYGVDDTSWGERVEAAVVGGGLDVDELRSHCRHHLAAYKVPKIIRIVDALPYTPNLKLDRTVLRRRAEAADAGA